MSVQIAVNPSNLFYQVKEITLDYLCVSIVAGSIDWFFSYLPIRPSGIIGTLVSILQLSLSTSFSLGIITLLKGVSGVSIFFPIFVWSWSPRAARNLQESYRSMHSLLYGADTPIENNNSN